MAHIAGSVNTAADFFCRLELKVTKKIRLGMWKDVQITPIEVTSSSDVADEEQFFFRQTDGEIETNEQSFERKQPTQRRKMGSN